MKKTILFLIILLCISGIKPLNAASVVGQITDASTKQPLQGASVIIKGSAYSGLSDRSGEYQINALKSGHYTVAVSYLGYKSSESKVTVGDEGQVSVDFSLQSAVLPLNEVFIIGGERSGQMGALNRQKTAANIKNIISSEQIASFPDANAAEALQRIPAIAVQHDQGEGRYIVIRGAEPNLNTVAINGERVPSPEGEVRNVALDVIPANALASIVVDKALTPDMDGDAIGGSINLITKSAFDSDHPERSIQLGSGYFDIRGKGVGTGSAAYGTRLGVKKNIGLLLTGSYHVKYFGSDNNEMEWDSFELADTSLEVEAVGELQLRDYSIIRDRASFGANLDYARDDGTRNYVRFLWNQFGDQEYRRRLSIRFDKGDFLYGNKVTEGTVERELKDRYEVQQIYTASFGGDHHLRDGMLDLDYNFAFSHSQEEEPESRYWTYVYDDDIDFTYDLSNPNLPKFQTTGPAGVNINDPSKYLLDEMSHEKNLTTDEEIAFQVNGNHHLELMSNPTSVKIGLKIRMKSKDRKNDVRIYSPENDESLTTLLDDYRTGDDFLGGAYKEWEVALHPDPDKSKDWFEANRGTVNLSEETDYESSDAANYDATEDVTAGYIMGTTNLGEQWKLLAGARIEATSVEYNGNQVTFDTDGDYAGTVKTSGTNDYVTVLPMIHAIYKFDRNTNLRLALTNSIGRPNYYDLVPYEFINQEDEEIARGNPSLDPARSMNIDLMCERYFDNVGILSAGVFAKTINDYIYPHTFEQTIGGIDYEVTQPSNSSETATLTGLELAWNQQLAFLPGWASGFGVYTNYTYTKSEIDYVLPDGSKRTSVIPGQSENMANFAVSWEKYGYAAKASLNYAGKHILTVGEDADKDEWLDTHTQLDLSVSKRVWRTMQVYMDFNNVTDEPMVVYIGDKDHPIQREFYSWWTQFGLKYTF